MSRIGIIREAVVAAGGEVSVYYADNSERIRLRDGDAVYKVPKWADGLNVFSRQQVVETLKQHPMLKTHICLVVSPSGILVKVIVL